MTEVESFGPRQNDGDGRATGTQAETHKNEIDANFLEEIVLNQHPNRVNRVLLFWLESGQVLRLVNVSLKLTRALQSQS